jgi:hypothetical protein
MIQRTAAVTASLLMTASLAGCTTDDYDAAQFGMAMMDAASNQSYATPAPVYRAAPVYRTTPTYVAPTTTYQPPSGSYSSGGTGYGNSTYSGGGSAIDCGPGSGACSWQ